MERGALHSHLASGEDNCRQAKDDIIDGAVAMDIVTPAVPMLISEVCEKRALTMPLSSPPQRGMKDPLRRRAVDGAFNQTISAARRGRTPSKKRDLAEMPDRHEDKAKRSRLAWARYRGQVPPAPADGAIDSFPTTLDVEGIRRQIDRFKYPVYIKKELRPPPPSIMEEERSRFPSISLWEALRK